MQQEQNAQEIGRLLPIKSVVDEVGFCKAKIYRLVAAGKFPKQRNIEGKALWSEAEINAWKCAQWESVQ